MIYKTIIGINRYRTIQSLAISQQFFWMTYMRIFEKFITALICLFNE